MSSHKHKDHGKHDPTPNQPEEESAAIESEKQPEAVAPSELELLRKEVAECKDKYLRALAEAENARKRMQKEKQDMIQYALQNVIVDFLNPIDHMENALSFTQQMPDEVKNWAIGFQMILSQFKDVLTNNGVTPFVSEGKPFDPYRHEAIESVSTPDFPPGTIVEESLRGYSMGDKTIRPARVKVSKLPTPSQDDACEENCQSEESNK